MKLQIRKCIKTDEKGIINVCFRTGFMGEDLTNMGRFNDRVLFGYLFCTYYVRYESENCFVAVDENGDIVGYILASLDSRRQKWMFAFRMVWRIVLRMLFYTSFVYPESFRSVISFIKNAGYVKEESEISTEYPAHLHINVLPDCQHSGAGSRLLEALEAHLKGNRVKGVHLGTSNHNLKALPFYSKKGFKIIEHKKGKLWSGIDDYESITFGKRLMD